MTIKTEIRTTFCLECFSQVFCELKFVRVLLDLMPVDLSVYDITRNTNQSFSQMKCIDRCEKKFVGAPIKVNRV